MRVEAHRLGVDRDHRPEVEPVRQVAAMEVDGHARAPLELGDEASWRMEMIGAQEKTRTSTTFRPLEPESSASTNSATWAPAGGSAGGNARRAACQSRVPAPIPVAKT